MIYICVDLPLCKSVTLCKSLSVQIATPLQYRFRWQAETFLFYDIPLSKLS